MFFSAKLLLTTAEKCCSRVFFSPLSLTKCTFPDYFSHALTFSVQVLIFSPVLNFFFPAIVCIVLYIRIVFNERILPSNEMNVFIGTKKKNTRIYKPNEKKLK